MKNLVIFISLLFLSCANSEVYRESFDSVVISPKVIELDTYTGEIINFHVKNPTAKNLHLNPDIAIYTKLDGKEYLIQRKNEITVKPSASFSFTIGGNKSSDETSLGLVIESSKELLVFNHKDFDIGSYNEKTIGFAINTKNLYYTRENTNILVSNEKLYGYINFYLGEEIFRIVPFKLELKNSSKENLGIDLK